MSRKPKKGYFVKGHFVAEGSELDAQLRAEQGKDEPSKTDLKRESTELQKLGEELLTLRADLMDRLDLPESLLHALDAARSITNFEGRRRQMQYVGKLMRGLDEDKRQEARDAVAQQHSGSAAETLALHMAERWRDELIADDAALERWVASHPTTDIQQLRALVRQARKDSVPTSEQVTRGEAPRRGRAFRDIFQIVRDGLEYKDRDDDDE
jgi:ribosome-associated protein